MLATLPAAAPALDLDDTGLPADDGFYFVHSRAKNLFEVQDRNSRTTGLVTRERRAWISLTRNGRIAQGVTKTEFPDTRNGRRAARLSRGAAFGNITLRPRFSYWLGTTSLSRAGLLTYPTEPKSIFDGLLAGAGTRGHSPEGEVFTEICDAVREQPTTRALRAGLYGAMALIPGIRADGAVTDSRGRAGVALSFTETGIRTQAVFDPKGFELLAERGTLIDPQKAGLPYRSGKIVEDVVYLERGVAKSIPRRYLKSGR
jgi:hypothetical protein